jgi:IgA Peptidase M64
MSGRSLLFVSSTLWLVACAGTQNASEPEGVVDTIGADASLPRVDAGQSGGTGAGSTGGSAAAASANDAGLPAAAEGGPGTRADAGGRDAAQSGDAGPSMPADPPQNAYQLDCGQSAIVLEAAGDPKNRVNYVIAGDGYTEAELETTYVQHLREMLRVRFQPALEPYARYRKFVNICALKVASPRSGIGTARGDSAFGGYGNDETRLGYIDDAKVRAAIMRLLPSSIEVDWTAVVLNSNRWWNAGGRFMVWSGAHKDAGLAAQHEGGHSFQLLADEYGGNCTFSGDEARMRINVTKDGTNTAGKWDMWLDFNQMPGTGVQDLFEGAQYCDRGAFRPSEESVMNMLWDSSYFNSISLENAIRLIYDVVDPIDQATPATTSAPGVFTVDVVDPAVIKIDWYVDGMLHAKAGGRALDVPALRLPAGSHTIRAHAYDDTPWVRGDRAELEQSLSWTVQVP